MFNVFSKTLDDVPSETEVALAVPLVQSNDLQNIGSFTPNQLVFAYNAVLTDSQIGKMWTPYSIRNNFIQAENGEKIRRALNIM